MSLTRPQWFASLASLTYPQMPAHAASAFKPYMPLLESFPDAAFTRESLEAVVTSPRKMAIPSYDEVLKPLSAWWRDNRPADQRFAISAPETPGRIAGPTDEEKSAVSGLLKRMNQDLDAIRPAAMAKPVVSAKPLSDGQLLMMHEAMARDGSEASRVRCEVLRSRMQREVTP